MTGEPDFDNNRGYQTEVIPESRVETVGEKLARLRLEVTELGELLKTAPPADKSQVNELQHLEKEIGKLIKRGNTDTQLLQKKLEGFQETQAVGGSSLQYELHLEKKLTSASGSQRATELESRIQRLEQILGNSKESLVSISPFRSNFPIAFTEVYK